MKFKKIAFFSVIFPSIEKYLEDFFRSLTEQTLKDFDLCLMNDGSKGLANLKTKYNMLTIHEVEASGTPAEIREAGINLLNKEGYEAIIFGDADDYFAKNRVERSAELLERCDIVVNDLNIVDEKRSLLEEHYLSRRIKPGSIVGPEFIKDKNVLGFSNTAVRTDAFDKVALNKDLIAVDWFFFGYLLNKGLTAIFTDETVTDYRQHSLNLVGIGKRGVGDVLKGLRAKLLQYEEMSRIDPGYAPLKEAFKETLAKVENDDSFRDFYLNRIKKDDLKDPLWWEEIKSSGELK